MIQRVGFNLLVTNPEKSIRKGAIRYLKNIVDTDNIEWQIYKALFDYYKIDLDTPYQDLTDLQKEVILYGSKNKISMKLIVVGETIIARMIILKDLQI